MKSIGFILHRFVVVAALASIAGLANAAPICPDASSCISAILISARTGAHADEVAQMVRLQKMVPDWRSDLKKKPRPGIRDEVIGIGAPDVALTRVLQNAQQDFAHLPEYQRALTLHYLQQKQFHLAEKQAKDGITIQPAHAPFWTDLAAVLAAREQYDDAVAALAVAHNWALDPAAMRQAYVKTSHANDSGAIFDKTVKLLDKQSADLAQLEAAFPPLVLSRKDPATGNQVPRPGVDGCTKPAWAYSSLRYEEQGAVRLALLVDNQGKLVRAKKIASSGYSELDNAALLAMAGCQFTAAKLDGALVPAWFVVEYNWTLEISRQAKEKAQ